jgi:hypothetical protein
MIRREAKKPRTVPWGWLTMVVLLTASLALAVVRGQAVGAIIVAVLLVPALVFVVAWVRFGRDDNS